jgi:hypothetical protein
MKTILLLLIASAAYCQTYQYGNVYLEVDNEIHQKKEVDILFNIDLDNLAVKVYKIVAKEDTMKSIFYIVDLDVSKRFGLFMAVDFTFCIDYKKNVMMVADGNKKLFFYNEKL